MKKGQPISPDEALETKLKDIPGEVIDVFNELIVKNFACGSATIMQSEAVKLITNRLEVDRQTVFDNKWLDVEPLFQKHGWKVEYDKPGYNESYEAFFVFSKR